MLGQKIRGWLVCPGLVAALVLGVSTVISGGSPASAATATTAPGPVSNVVASVTGDQATITWQPPAAGTVARYQVHAYLGGVNGTDYGSRIVSAPSIVWDRLPFNQTVQFAIAAIGPDLATGASGPGGPVVDTPVVKATNTYCPPSSSSDCVVVNTTDPQGPEARPDSGLLHGTVPAGNGYAPLLQLNHWRIQANNETQYQQATAYVPPSNIIAVISDAWFTKTATQINGVWYAADPWANWTTYTNYVTATVYYGEMAGKNPYWEIQNEPENYPYSPTQPANRTLVEQEYLYAYQAIKAVDPNARVIGPSIDWQYENNNPLWYIDMKTFIQFAGANGMSFAALAWHDNYDQSDTNPVNYSESPQWIRDQAAEVRELIAENPGVGNPVLFVDENSSAAGQFSPGWASGYAAEEDRAGIALGGRACWPYPGDTGSTANSDCFGPYLDQLLNKDGLPDASFWAMADYGSMTGSRVWSESTDTNLSSLAVTDPSGVTRLLLGSHRTCSGWTAGAQYCPVTTPPAPVPTTVKVLLPLGAASASVTVQELADNLADLPGAPASSTATVPVNNGVATVALPSFSDGEAYFITVTPDSTAGASPSSGNQSNTAATVVSSSPASVAGQPVTFTATFAPIAPATGTPTGAVTFWDGNAVIGSAALAAGTASITTSALALGSATVVAQYAGDSAFQSSLGYLPVYQVVSQAAATATISSSVDASSVGQPVTFTVSVSPVAPSTDTPTGTVTFLDGTTTIGSAALTGGTASMTTTTLPVGRDAISATYSGDDDFLGASGSLAGGQTVGLGTSTVTLTSSSGSVLFGQGLILTATVGVATPSAGTPSGSVTFYDGSASIGSGTLANGVVSLTTSDLAVGSHTISATYGGDGNFAGSSGTLPGGQSVAPAATGVILGSSANPSPFGQPVTLTATVGVVAPGGGTPTGTVDFFDGSTSIGTATLIGGVASLTTTGLPVGNHNISTTYSGDADFVAASASLAGGQLVSQAASAIAISSSSSRSVFGQAVTLSATVGAVAPGAGTPTGTVTFYDGTASVGSATVTNGVASLTTSALAVGSHTISATYSGDVDFGGVSGSLAGGQSVTQAGSTVSLTSSVSPSVFGQAVTLKATVKAVAPGAGGPTGKVTFYSGSTSLGSATVTSGVASLTTSALAVGSHTISATYSGDVDFGGVSGSLPGGQSVSQAGSAVALTASVNPSVYRQAVTFRATVKAVAPGVGTPTGTVTFYNGSASIGSATLSNGVASLTTSALAVGSHTISATYKGDPSFRTSTASMAFSVVK